MTVCLAFRSVPSTEQELNRFSLSNLNEEWDAAASFECESHPHPPTCLFGDLAQFFVPSIQANLEEFRSKNLLTTKLMELVVAGVAIQTCLSLLTQSHVILCYVLFCYVIFEIGIL